MENAETGSNAVIRAPAAAERLGIDPKLLRRKLRFGEIAGYQIGTTWFVYLSALEDKDAIASSLPRQTITRNGAEISDLSGRIFHVPDERPSALTYESMADWTPWVPFSDARLSIPRMPGVYIARVAGGDIVYVGMAAERRGNGMRGRLAIYATGKGGTSGLGEGALDLALADPNWMKERLSDAERGQPLRAKELAKAAVERANLELCWTTAADGPAANELELRVIRSFSGQFLWNRRR